MARTQKSTFPKPEPIPRPRVKDLREAYRGLVNVSVVNRVSVLSLAVHWYDAAFKYVRTKRNVTEADSAKLETALKCRKTAMRTDKDGEKEAAFLAAIRIYEKVCSLIGPPSVDEVLKELEERKPKLIERQEKLTVQYGAVLKLLQKAIGNRLNLEVADSEKPLQYNAALTTLSYNRTLAKHLTEKMKKEGFLAVFVDQLEMISRQLILNTDEPGTYLPDKVKQFDAAQEILADFVKFARSSDAPKKLVRVSYGPDSPVRERAPRVGGKRQVSTGPKVAGRYGENTLIAKLYRALEDGKEHSVKELFKELPTTNPMSSLRYLQWDGKRFKGWQVDIRGDVVKMTVKEPS